MHPKKKKAFIPYVLVTQSGNRRGQNVAFPKCQHCDKSCLNFTQSEIKCQQKLLPKLSDQVRQTTNRKKSIKHERWTKGMGIPDPAIPIGASSISHVPCQLVLLLMAMKQPEVGHKLLFSEPAWP